MGAFQVRVVSVCLVAAVASASGITRGLASQDVLQSASLIFIRRPKNPPVRHRPSAPKTQAIKQSNSTSLPGNVDTKSRSSRDLSDETEDALALANSARDAQPPRFDDAQKAYQLAAKLSPKDPRPYMGLANIWYDQKHYEEAARMYRAAAQLMVSSNAAVGTNPSTKATVRGKSSKATEVVPGDLRAYLGNALLQAAQFSDAERELRIAILEEPKNDQLYALLGYSLLQQNKRPEAITAFRTAVTLSPDNATYKELLAATLNHP